MNNQVDARFDNGCRILQITHTFHIGGSDKTTYDFSADWIRGILWENWFKRYTVKENPNILNDKLK